MAVCCLARHRGTAVDTWGGGGERGEEWEDWGRMGGGLRRKHSDLEARKKKNFPNMALSISKTKFRDNRRHLSPPATCSLSRSLLFTLCTLFLGRISDLLPSAVGLLRSARSTAPLPRPWSSETLITLPAQNSSPKSPSSVLPSSHRKNL